MTTVPKKQKWWALSAMAIAIIGLLLAYFLPTIIFVIDRGGIKIADPRDIIGVEIEVGGGWFPLYSSQTTLGKLIISSKSPPTVVFCKVNWLTPWNCQQAAIYRHEFSIEGIKARGLFTQIEKYSWGQAGIVRADSTQTPGNKMALILDHGLAVSSGNLEILPEIKKIKPKP